MNKIFVFVAIIWGLSKSLCAQEDCELKLIHFEPSECKEEYHVYKLNNRISSVEKYGDTTIVELTVKANCCVELNPYIKLSSDTLDLFYDYTEIINDSIPMIIKECECECCFSFRFHIVGLDDRPYMYRCKGNIIEPSTHKYKITQEVSFEIYSGDTINFVDIYGFKQGLHRYFDNTGREIRALNYIDDQIQSGLLKREFYSNGKKREIYFIDENSYKVLLYSAEGEIIKQFTTSSILDI